MEKAAGVSNNCTLYLYVAPREIGVEVKMQRNWVLQLVLQLINQPLTADMQICGSLLQSVFVAYKYDLISSYWYGVYVWVYVCVRARAYVGVWVWYCV